MPLSNAQLQDEIAVVLGTGARSDDPLRVSIQRWINQSCRRIAYAYPWDEMRSDQTIVTVAPYGTGTVTATINSKTVTGAGTTFTVAMEGRKFALVQGGPFYRIATYVSATEVTLAENYVGATVAGSPFVVFQNEYDLNVLTHAIEDTQVIDNAVWYPPLRLYDQREIDAVDYLGRTTGRPSGLCVCASTTVGTPRIRFVPVPDAVYRVNMRYLRKWVPMASPNDVYTAQGLPEDVEGLILDGALRWAPRVEGSRAVLPDKEWSRQLANIWAGHKPGPYGISARRGIGRGAMSRIYVNFTGIAT